MRASFMVLTGEVPHVTVTLMLGDTRPIQFSFSVLKRTPAVCSASIEREMGWRSQREAVLGRDIIDVVRGQDAAGARHVLRRHGRLAGNMIADMAGDQPAEQVIAAARSASR